MIDDLKNLEIYACASLLHGRCLRGHNGTTEPDIGSFKKGLRYCNDLNWMEAWFRTLEQVGLLNAAKDALEKIYYTPNVNTDVGAAIKNARHNERHYKGQAANRDPGDKYKENDLASAKQWKLTAEFFEMLFPHEDDAHKMYASLPKNRSKNVDWKDLRCVQFYAYDAKQNSFVECNLKGEAV